MGIAAEKATPVQGWEQWTLQPRFGQPLTASAWGLWYPVLWSARPEVSSPTVVQRTGRNAE